MKKLTWLAPRPHGCWFPQREGTPQAIAPAFAVTSTSLHATHRRTSYRSRNLAATGCDRADANGCTCFTSTSATMLLDVRGSLPGLVSSTQFGATLQRRSERYDELTMTGYGRCDPDPSNEQYQRACVVVIPSPRSRYWIACLASTEPSTARAAGRGSTSCKASPWPYALGCNLW